MSSHYSKVEWQIPAVLTLSLSYSVSVGQLAVQLSLQELFSAITEDLMAMMCRYNHFFSCIILHTCKPAPRINVR